MLVELVHKDIFFLPALGIRLLRLGVFNNTDCFKNGVTKIKDEEAQHKWDCIKPVDKCIGNHYPGIEE